MERLADEPSQVIGFGNVDVLGSCQLVCQGSLYDVIDGINASIELDHNMCFNVDIMRQVWDNEEVVTQMSVVPSYVHSTDDLGGGHGCRPGTEREAAVLCEMW